MSSICLCARRFGLALLLGGLLGASAVAQAPQPAAMPPEVAALHDQLRGLKDRAVAAVNKRDPDALMSELDPGVTFTAMNNEVVRGIEQAKAYYQKMLVGSARILEDMSLKVDVDELTKLYENNTIGLATGTAIGHFRLVTGTEFDMPLRWSATLHRANDKWSILNLHFSANVFDNPLLDAVKWTTKWIAIAAGVVAIILGFLVGRWSRRKTA
ncbi:MAG TPA: nuclear transport factor 2 family protein [Xanthobacteraceae bacterium]|nr:nuclear transport factor 2 family protein [Xanthobacteraceae bacterium]